ncbi:unnamed protein product [Linum tenue]|uniref:Uncharacterized protein n=1 Tax=Linum tenue TaxID=586396 RepID=A0AAV0P8R3_9ROSI|nr:unnamed protein product [Linum tenue]
MGGGDQRSVQGRQGLAGDLQHGGGSRSGLRRRRQADPRRQGQAQFSGHLRRLEPNFLILLLCWRRNRFWDSNSTTTSRLRRRRRRRL